MATIVKRRKKDGSFSYTVLIRLEGHKPVTKTWSLLADAKRWASQTETELRRGLYFDTAPKKNTLSEAIDKFTASLGASGQNNKYILERCRNLEYWREKLGDHAIDEIEPHHIETLQNELLTTISVRTKRVLSPATVILYTISLNLVFEYICRVYTNSPWLKHNILKLVEKPKPPKGRERYLQSTEEGDNELERLVDACREIVEIRKRKNTLKKSPGSLYLYNIVQLALLTGLRRGEIRKLKWVDVNFQESTLRLYNTKNGSSYTLPLVTQALLIFKEQEALRREDSNYIFPAKDGLKAVDWRCPFKEAVQFAGLKNFRFHDTRHTYLSYGAMSGASKSLLKAMGRHKSDQSSERYVHLAPHYVVDQTQKMVDKRFGPLLGGTPKDEPI